MANTGETTGPGEYISENEAENQEKRNLDFIEAAGDGNLEAVKSFLESVLRVDINAKSRTGGRTALYSAVLFQYCEPAKCQPVVKLLLNSGADYEIKDVDGETPLWRAAESGNAALFQLLLERGANVNAKDCQQKSILHLIVSHNNGDMMSLLLSANEAKQDLDIDPEDEDGATPLWHAVSNNNGAFIRLLLSRGADIKTKNNDDVSILHLAAQSGNHVLVAKALLAGATADLPDKAGRLPISNAIASGNKETVESLLSVHFGHDDGTIFYEAVKANSTDMVRILLQRFTERAISSAGLSLVTQDGVPMPEIARMLNSKAEDGKTPLLQAISNDNLEVVELLLLHGAMINDKDSNGETPLLRAVMNENLSFVKLLLDRGAEFQGFDSYGDSELSYAVYLGNKEIVTRLLDQVPPPNIESANHQQMTPLLWAAGGGDVGIGQLLISKGANILALDDAGISTLFYATYGSHIEFMELLLKELLKASQDVEMTAKQPKISADGIKLTSDVELSAKLPKVAAVDVIKNNLKLDLARFLELKPDQGMGGRTPLLIAAANGSKDAVTILLKNGANHNARDDQGWTALHHATVASKSVRLEVVNTILTTGAAAIVNAKNEDGNTALHLAADANYEDVIDLLVKKCPPYILGKVTRYEKSQHAISLSEKNNVGKTALSLATENGYASLVQLLVVNAADVGFCEVLNADNELEWVPANVESEVNSDQVESLLKERKPKWKEADQLGILYWGARHERAALVDNILLKNSSWEGDALYWAAIGSSTSVMKSLIERKESSSNDAQKWLMDNTTVPRAIEAAARNQNRETVKNLLQLLMKRNPEQFRLGLTQEDTVTWKTSLHWVVHYKPAKLVSIVRNLLMTEAEIGNVSPFSLDFIDKLKQKGVHEDIISMLETPLRRTGQPTRLMPPEEPSEGTKDACKSFDVNIIDAYTWKNQSCTMERIAGVHEMLYGKNNGPQEVMENARKAWNLHSIGLQHNFRWIHLPANNWTWVKDIMKRVMMDSQRTESANSRSEAFTRLDNFVDLNSREHIGRAHERCVYPFIAFQGEDIFSAKGLNITEILQMRQAEAIYDSKSKLKRFEGGKATRGRGQESRNAKSDQLVRSEDLDQGIDRASSHPLSGKDNGPPPVVQGLSNESSEQKDPSIEARRKDKNLKPSPMSLLPSSQMALCMPFLTFQKVERHKSLRQAMRVVEEIFAKPGNESPEALAKAKVEEITGKRKDARWSILVAEIKLGRELLQRNHERGALEELNLAVRDISDVSIKNRMGKLWQLLDRLEKTPLFLTPDNVEWMERFSDAIELYEQRSHDLNSKDFKYENLILQYYTGPNNPKGLHLSRTLDQYYYSALSDTSRRDRDQVARQYQNKKKNIKIPVSKINIGMVDQLWLWIIDSKTVISCFPRSTDEQPESDVSEESKSKSSRPREKELLDKIRTHIHDAARPQIKSIYHLATIIASFCVADIEDSASDVTSNETFLQIFASSIATVADSEVRCFEAFKRDIWRGERENNDTYHHVIEEVGLLEIIKDIRDELNILKSIFRDQKDLLEKMFAQIANSDSSGSHEPVLNYYMERASIDLRIGKVKKMDRDAKTVYDSLNHLLDLKQKHANIKEAADARAAAEEMTKQSRTIMVFTSVTIIFLPMSFLTSIFALNVQSYPHSGDSVLYPSGWIFSRIFGTSIAIGFPLLIVAFGINEIIDRWKAMKKAVEKYLSAIGTTIQDGYKDLKGEQKETEDSKWQRTFIDNMSSNAPEEESDGVAAGKATSGGGHSVRPCGRVDSLRRKSTDREKHMPLTPSQLEAASSERHTDLPKLP